jgi:DNA-binding transcriptional LysR family regulator
MNELPLSLLQALVAVAESRSFSRAARLLGTSQSTVSTQIRRLEERVGTILLERTTRSVVPTAAAQRLLPIARDMLRLQRIALSRLDARPLSGLAVLAIDESVALSHGVIDLARGFAETWPDVDLRIEVVSAAAVAERFEAGLVDLALVHGAGATSTQAGTPVQADTPARAGTPAQAGAELGRDRLGWFGHLPVPAPDRRWPMIGLPRGGALRTRIDAALAAGGMPHRVTVEADSLAIGVEAARQGFGLIALPVPLARRHLLEPAHAEGLPALGSWPVRLLQRDALEAAAVALRNELRQAWPARRARLAP